MAIFDNNIFVKAASSAPMNSISIQEYVAECISYEKHQHDIEHSKQNMMERKVYASWIFQFTSLWCLGLFIILFGCGLGKLELSNIVITTFIGSTTINVFIFFKLVTEYLFNKENPHS
ncbi:hypothetical protein [Flavobacterium sp. UBA6135]|uniref:hypothetical protein n=1 Tax=Flavobacterium sp. UBA6135 TaxID=1946553 RepID=UPI0025BE788E|nr:hypothetical protein [Flavobacterium sp. UBA6135]